MLSLRWRKEMKRFRCLKPCRSGFRLPADEEICWLHKEELPAQRSVLEPTGGVCKRHARGGAAGGREAFCRQNQQPEEEDRTPDSAKRDRMCRHLFWLLKRRCERPQVGGCCRRTTSRPPARK
ncbi:cortexin-1 isoform X1 [Paroedura picta]|uniref:cortexin-1 isoform X1 n=1 Tax=Paroedura picta TaxID=143630 RepID=UPI004056817D